MSNTEALRGAESALTMALDDLLNCAGSRRSIPAVNTAINIVRAALAQPAASGKPVARVDWEWRDGRMTDHRVEWLGPIPDDGVLLYTAQPAPALVPPGWVLVPADPTIEMQIAGQEAWVQMNATRPALEDCMQATVAYIAMLAAAPDAQQEPKP